MVVALLENTTILLGRRAVRADPKNICFKKNHAYLPTPDPVPCPTHHRVQLALRKGINERVNGVPRLCKVAEAKQRIRMALRAVAGGGLASGWPMNTIFIPHKFLTPCRYR